MRISIASDGDVIWNFFERMRKIGMTGFVRDGFGRNPFLRILNVT